jgi:hypothetical protein
MVESKNENSSDIDLSEGGDNEEDKVEVFHQQRRPREESMRDYVNLISEYASNGTYFVRKISAQALLPLVKFE